MVGGVIVALPPGDQAGRLRVAGAGRGDGGRAGGIGAPVRPVAGPAECAAGIALPGNGARRAEVGRRRSGERAAVRCSAGTVHNRCRAGGEGGFNPVLVIRVSGDVVEVPVVGPVDKVVDGGPS